jgi:DNA-directed RNA polymerase subunit E'/Rpb7
LILFVQLEITRLFNNMKDVDEIFFPSIIDRVVCLSILKINQNAETQILQILRQQIEGKCVDQGFVRPNSIKLRHTSIGKLNGSDIHFNVTFRADVCNPLTGVIVHCKINTVTKAGLNCNVYDKITETYPITVFITRQSHDDAISNSSAGDNISARIYATTFQINDTHICALANFEKLL